ncbi:FxLYD domain-containing protein [Paenibacillus sp. sgz302251]|uniref:FxLYD domain-containing protein n=1 Tax=Paenibacillus sp. sgz302251 TaxID=3414493 RepID=UPI003C7B2146
MYCHHCGKKRTDDAIYCSQCGRLLEVEMEFETEASAEAEAGAFESAAAAETAISNEQRYMPKDAGKQGGARSLWAWLTPVLLAFVTAAVVFAYYSYESDLNDRVMDMQADARSMALTGKYAEALAMLKEAADARPDYAALQADVDIVSYVIELEHSAAAAGMLIEERKLSEAKQALEQVRDALRGHSEPIFAKVKEQLEVHQVKLGVMTLTEELAELKTVDELEAKLNVANNLDSDEAIAVREQIVARIVEISYAEAEALLGKKNYNDALAVTNRALDFALDDEKLTELEERIRQAQEQYEQAEQQRLEQAMQNAAAEDLKNQTAAVEVVNIETTLDEFGDLNIAGELKNAATRPIYGISIQFTVMDAEGNELGSGTADATPQYVEPGETMSFSSTVYGVYVDNTTVVVDHATWYLD